MTINDYIKCIKRVVVENCSITEEQLLSIKKNSEYVDARDIYILLLRKHLSLNLTRIAKEVNKTIPTISLSLERIESKIANDKSIRFQILVCERSLKTLMEI